MRRNNSGRSDNVLDRLGPSKRPNTADSQGSGSGRDYHPHQQQQQQKRRGVDYQYRQRPQGASGSRRNSPGRPPRHEDRDGDIMGMGVQSSADRSGLVEVSILGWKGADDQDSVVQFINRKVERPIEIKQIRYEGENMIVGLPHFGQANALTKLSGIRFAGGKLTFKILGGVGANGNSDVGGFDQSSGSNSGRPSVIQTLQTILQSRYQPQAKYLNLEGLQNDSSMHQSGINGFVDPRSKTGVVICKLIGDLFPEVESISFANNNLRNLKSIESLPSRVPNLLNLSFQNNQLSSYRDIDCFPGKDLTRLREILFTGNPIRESQSNRPGGELNYRSDIKKIFPSIQILDQQPVVEEVKFDLGDVTSGPGAATIQLPETKGPFMDSPVTLQTANDFVQRFFRLFDSNRHALADLYHPNSTFSLSINTVMPFFARNKRREEYDQWWNMNRNLSRVTNSDKRVQTIKHGPSEILTIFATFPQTQHDLTSNNLLMDAFQIPLDGTGAVMLILDVHGYFTETTRGTYKRSFDRTFTVVPAPQGSRAQNAGYPYTILNDQLVLRTWNSKPSWTTSIVGATTGASFAGAAPVSTTPSVPAAPVTGMGLKPVEMNQLQQLKLQHQLNDQQCQLIVDFMKHTQLNIQYAWQCLTQTGWHRDHALQAFMNAKQQLPSEAYRV